MSNTRIVNQKGEQGGKILEAGDTFDSSVDGKYATGFTTIEDTVLTSIDGNYTDSDTKLIDPVLITARSFVAGVLQELTVKSGRVAVHYGEM